MRRLSALGVDRIDHITDSELEALYPRCRATVHASLAEGFGLPARESIARRIPALMSTAIPRDGLPDGTYRLFDPSDAGQLAELMADAIRHPVTLQPIEPDGTTGWEPVVSALLD